MARTADLMHAVHNQGWQDAATIAAGMSRPGDRVSPHNIGPLLWVLTERGWLRVYRTKGAPWRWIEARLA